jgi:hypothetical protein
MFWLRIRKIKRNKLLVAFALILIIAQSQLGMEQDNHAQDKQERMALTTTREKVRQFPLPDEQQIIQPVLEVQSGTNTRKDDPRAQELDQLVQAITTVTEFIGGQEERNRGSGFVVGNRFFTVNHNLTTAFPTLRLRSTTFINEMSISTPVFADEEQDVAVFELPDQLCIKHCNSAKVALAPDLSPARKVYWLRKFEDEFILKEAAILKSVMFGEVENSTAFLSTPAMGCHRNSVVLVDQPFISGTSGSPVMDAETGKIIGVIQGSVGASGAEKGYFKPINCVLAMLPDTRSTDAFVGL